MFSIQFKGGDRLTIDVNDANTPGPLEWSSTPSPEGSIVFQGRGVDGHIIGDRASPADVLRFLALTTKFQDDDWEIIEGQSLIDEYQRAHPPEGAIA